MTTTARPDTMSLMLLPSWRNGHRPNRVLGQCTHSMVRPVAVFHEFCGKCARYRGGSGRQAFGTRSAGSVA